MRYRAIIAMLLFFAFSAAGSYAQSGRHQSNLTELLEKISAQHKVKISYSPSLTNSVIPENCQTVGTVEEALTKVLEGTGFSYKKLNSSCYYIFRKGVPTQKKKEVKKPEPVKPQPDTVVMHTVKVSVSEPVKQMNNSGTISGGEDTSNKGISRSHHSFATLTEGYVIPRIAVKSNLLLDVTGSLNFGVEASIAPKWTVDFSAEINPFKGSESSLRSWMVMPEARYWLKERFGGHFFGIYADCGQYDCGGKLFGKDNKESDYLRYDGSLAGAGLSYGFHWVLGGSWGFEAEIGAGYTRLDYDKYIYGDNGKSLGNGSRNYFGVSKAAVSLVYFIR